MIYKILPIFISLFFAVNLFAEDHLKQISDNTTLSNNKKIEIIIVSSENETKIKSIVDAALKKAKDTDKLIRADIEKINTNYNEVSPITLDFLKEAVNLSEVTDGWFDITAPSKKGWFTKKDYRRIELMETPPTVKLKSSDMKLDIDLLLSAYIVDRISADLIENGYTNGLITLNPIQKGFGNDLYSPWSINIPKQDYSNSRAYIANHYGIKNAGWITLTNDISIIDSKSKKPIIPWYINMTILSNKAATATAFAVSIASLGEKVGPVYLQTHNVVEGVITTTKGELFASKAFKLASPFQSKEVKGDFGPANVKLKQKEEEAEIKK